MLLWLSDCRSLSQKDTFSRIYCFVFSSQVRNPYIYFSAGLLIRTISSVILCIVDAGLAGFIVNVYKLENQIIITMIESNFSSLLSENLKPTQLDLPLEEQIFDTFHIKTVPTTRSQETLQRIKKIEGEFPPTLSILILIHLIFGILLCYTFVLLIVISLFNLILFFIFILVLMRYAQWSINNVRRKREKMGVKRIKEVLQSQNKNYYSRKLIRWAYDSHEHRIVIHNLRHFV